MCVNFVIEKFRISYTDWYTMKNGIYITNSTTTTSN